MNSCSKRIVSGLIFTLASGATLTSLSSCGLFVGKKHKPTSSTSPTTPAPAPNAPSNSPYIVDTKALQDTDNKIHEVTGFEPLWTVRTSQSGKELTKVENGTVTDVIGSLSGLKFKTNDIALFEITIVAKSDNSIILATNLKAEAQKTERSKLVWDAECENIVKPDIEFKNNSSYSGKGMNIVKLTVCDIEGAFAAPGVKVIAQPKFYEIKTAAFMCERKATSNNYFFYSFGSKDCVMGYEYNRGEEEKTLYYPKSYIPNAPGSKSFNLSSSIINTISGYASFTELDLNTVPFPMTCHTVRFDLYAGDALDYKPLTFKKVNGVFEQIGAKTPASAEASYRSGNAAAFRKIFILCDWANEVKDGAVLLPSTPRP